MNLPGSLAFLVACLAFSSEALACAFPGEGFRRGDANCNGEVEIGDAIHLINHLFRGSRDPECLDAADANDDGRVDITDVATIFFHLFRRRVLPEQLVERDATHDGLGCRSGRQPCPELFTTTLIGVVRDPTIQQPSGIGVSRVNAGALWLVNDADARQNPRLYAITMSGELLAVFTLDTGDDTPSPPFDCSRPLEQVHCDWEGLALGPGPDLEPTIFIGDVGGNRFPREVFSVHRVEEPVARSGVRRTLRRERGDFDSLFFRYDVGGSFDAETLLCDPRTGALYIVSQSPRPSLYRYPAPHVPGKIVTLEHICDLPEIPGDSVFVSGGDISPSGESLILKAWINSGFNSVTHIFIYPWSREDPGAALHAGPPCRLDLEEYLGPIVFHAGAVAFDTDRSFLSLEEQGGSPIFRMEY